MIFDKPIFNKDQPQMLEKELNARVWIDGCGLNAINFKKNYQAMKNKYLEKSSEQMIGLGNVHIESYQYFIGITSIPCVRIHAVPLIVKNRTFIKQ